MTSTKYEPPCKAGDTVYVIIKDKNAREVYPCKVVKVRILRYWNDCVFLGSRSIDGKKKMA